MYWLKFVDQHTLINNWRRHVNETAAAIVVKLCYVTTLYIISYLVRIHIIWHYIHIHTYIYTLWHYISIQHRSHTYVTHLLVITYFTVLATVIFWLILNSICVDNIVATCCKFIPVHWHITHIHLIHIYSTVQYSIHCICTYIHTVINIKLYISYILRT
jgi:hypothetical protein